MSKHGLLTLLVVVLAACGGSQTPAPNSAAKGGAGTSAEATGAAAPSASSASSSETGSGEVSDGEEFKLNKSRTAGAARGVKASKLKATKTEALMKFVVVDKKTKKPISGVVIRMMDPEGKKYYTQETDALGYAEVLAPVGKHYKVIYLTLGRADIEKTVKVADEPNQNIKLTLRFLRFEPAPPVIRKTPTPPPAAPERRVILEGVEFDTAKSTLREVSFPRLDRVVEYMTHKKGVRIELSGHTDSVGSDPDNKKLSDDRAKVCREYLISKGIEPSRVKAVGFGEERPIATNDTLDGRQKNRRTEVKEL